MTWPPVKAWSSSIPISNQVYFVAINYGGKLKDRWVILMSVLDSSVVIKVSWATLVDVSKWKCGWDYDCYLDTSLLVKEKYEIKSINLTNPSDDSGLTMPITRKFIRPWFNSN